MKYKELMDKCSEIWKMYANEGNSYLGLNQAWNYCCAHFRECEDITPKQIADIEKNEYYKSYCREKEEEQRKKEQEKNREEHPEEYQHCLELKKKFGV